MYLLGYEVRRFQERNIICGIPSYSLLFPNGQNVNYRRRLLTELWLRAGMKTKRERQVLVRKGKGFYSGVAQPGRMVDSCLKYHLPLLLKSAVKIGTGRERLFFIYIVASFCHAGGSIRSHSQCKTSPCHHLGQWGWLPGAPMGCLHSNTCLPI